MTVTPIADIWVHPANDADEEHETVVAGLRSAGLRVVQAEAAPTTPGAFLVRGPPDPSSLTELAALTKRGRRRALVIALDEAAPVDPWKLLEFGGADVLTWGPGCPAQAAARFKRWRDVDEVLASPVVATNLIGSSPAWVRALRDIVELGKFTSAPVLLTGESGTGKELAARLIHSLDPRLDKGDLIVLDCTTIVPTLSGSEFFGHQRGAFTGAVSARAGAFELADGGTLFLDEVGELPLPLQAELLRVIQEGTYKRVGSNEWLSTDFRLICATNKDLTHEQDRGAFRRDFYHRLAASSVHLPPLRDRAEDILPLAQHFLAELQTATAAEFDPVVRDLLVRRDFPGNVRELRQLVGRMAARHVGPGPISAGHVPEEERPGLGPSESQSWLAGLLEVAVARAVAAGVSLKDIGVTASDVAVQIALDVEGGNVRAAAGRLGVTARALQMRRAHLRRSGGEARVELA